MSVGLTPANGYADIPGYQSLGLAGRPSAASNTTIAAAHSSVAGFDALGIQGNGKSSTPAPDTTAPNVYQNAYDGLISASNNYLQQSLLNGNPAAPIPLYAAGSSAQQFALLQNTLAALSTGLQNGQFQGTGFNALA